MQVDWAGDPLYITDPVTGEKEPAYIFVAVLAVAGARMPNPAATWRQRTGSSAMCIRLSATVLFRAC